MAAAANYSRASGHSPSVLTNPSDADAIARSLDDPHSFEVVFKRHQQAVLKYLRRRVGDDLADELTGETFTRALRQRASYRATHETALPWLYGISVRVVAEHRRAEKRRLRALERLGHRDARPGGYEETGSVAPEIVRALRRLPAGERNAVLLVAWGELSYEETARALDVPIGTVRSRISRARRRLEGSFPLTPMTTSHGEAHA